MPTTIYRILSLLVAFGVVAATAQGRADDADDDLARAHFDAAQAHFETGSYEDAIGEFSEAHRLSGRPALLYNIYLCHERLGNLEAAIENLARYLESAPDTANAAALRTRLDNLRRRAASVHAREELATPEPPAAEKARTPVADGAPADLPAARSKAPAVAALAVGGVGIAAFGAFALLTRHADAQLDESCASACDDAEVRGLRSYALAADISLGVGLSGLMVGGALWLVRRNGGPRVVQVAPVAGQRSVGLVAEGQF